jgi:hypothetical protein
LEGRDLLGKGGEMLCRVGEFPAFWQYGAAELEERIGAERIVLKDRFPEFFPWKSLGSVESNEDFEDIYRMSYWEAERVLIYIVKAEAVRMHNTKSYRTEDTDIDALPRYRGASSTPRKAGPVATTPSRRGTNVQPKIMLRTAKLTILRNGGYSQINFIDFYESDALLRYNQTGPKGEHFPFLNIFTNLCIRLT